MTIPLTGKLPVLCPPVVDPATLGLKVKTCVVCGASKGSNLFPSRKDGTISDMCTGCHISKPMAKREKLTNALHRMVKESRPRAVTIDVVGNYVTTMMELYGGLAGFCRELKYQIDLASTDNKTRRTAIDAMMKILNVALMVANSQDNKADLTTATDEEIEEAINQYTLRIAETEDESGEKDRDSA